MPDHDWNLYHFLRKEGRCFSSNEQKALDNCKTKITIEDYCSRFGLTVPEADFTTKVPTELLSIIDNRVCSITEELRERRKQFYEGIKPDTLDRHQTDITNMFKGLQQDIDNGKPYVAQVMLNNYLGLEIKEPESSFEQQMKEAQRKYKKAQKIIWGTAAALITGLVIHWVACDTPTVIGQPSKKLEKIIEK